MAELVRIWDACAELPQPWQTVFRLVVVTGAPIREILRLRPMYLHHGDPERLGFWHLWGILADELVKDFTTSPDAFLFRGRKKTSPLAFQQHMLERLRARAWVQSFTCRDIGRAVNREVPNGADRQQEWNAKLAREIEEFRLHQKVDL